MNIGRREGEAVMLGRGRKGNVETGWRREGRRHEREVGEEGKGVWVVWKRRRKIPEEEWEVTEEKREQDHSGGREGGEGMEMRRGMR